MLWAADHIVHVSLYMFIWNWHRWIIPGSNRVLLQRVRGTALVTDDLSWHVVHIKWCGPSQQHAHEMCCEQTGAVWQTVKDTSENTGCCCPAFVLRMCSLELETLCMAEVMWFENAVERRRPGQLHNYGMHMAVTSLACWLLRSFDQVWNCRYQPPHPLSKNAKNDSNSGKHTI